MPRVFCEYFVNSMWSPPGDVRGVSHAASAFPSPRALLLPPCVVGLPCSPAQFCCPIPPTPFPAGEGGDHSFLMQGATAPCIPACAPNAARVPGTSPTPGGKLSSAPPEHPAPRTILLPHPSPPSPLGKGGWDGDKIFYTDAGRAGNPGDKPPCTPETPQNPAKTGQAGNTPSAHETTDFAIYCK